MRILAVAEEVGVVRLIEAACKTADISCIAATSPDDAVGWVRECGLGFFDVALLDAAMLVVTGWACCGVLRGIDAGLELVMLLNLERGDEVECGLAFGAEDFIVKPLTHESLVAKLRYIRERHKRPHVIHVGPLRYDPVQHSTFVNGHRVDLTDCEARLLLELCLHHGEIVTHAQLFERIWHMPAANGSNREMAHMANLRRKLRAEGADVIHTVWGKGYCIPREDRRNGKRPDP
jgi:DNA-binding response OmpR family regulator